MVLSDNGDHPMTKLSDTQAVILSAAAQRDNLSVLPLPEGLALNRPTCQRLRRRGFAPGGDLIAGGATKERCARRSLTFDPVN